MPQFSKRMAYMQEAASVTRHLMESMVDPSIISFGGGAPAREALPVETIQQLAQEVLSRDARGIEALQYGKPLGVTDLRMAALNHLVLPKNIDASLENIMIVGGGMEGLYLTAQILLEPGAVVLVESPTFVQSIQTFEMFEAECIACKTDDDGYDLEDLEAKIKLYHPRMIYVIPTFQNPSGRTTSLEKRKALARLANEYDIMLLEDDPYGDMRYSGDPIPPVKSFDKNDNVIYANSFSKIFSPGSRLGYICASEGIIRKLYDAKTASNSHTGMISQVLCAEFFNRGYFEPHLKKICGIHKERRDVMMECIRQGMPAGSKYIEPNGGLFTWVELPEQIDTSGPMMAAAAQAKVAYMPGEKFFVNGQPIRKNCMRLSFGGTEPERIRIGMERLCQVIRAQL